MGAAEKLPAEYGFPHGDVVRYLKTMIRTGKEYRQWSLEDAANGNLSRAWQNHKDAEYNLRCVNRWFRQFPELKERVL